MITSASYAYFDYWSNKLLHESSFNQPRPIVMNEVDDESFDVASVLILIAHDHQVTVPQLAQAILSVDLPILQPKDLDKVQYLLILHQLNNRVILT